MAAEAVRTGLACRTKALPVRMDRTRQTAPQTMMVRSRVRRATISLEIQASRVATLGRTRMPKTEMATATTTATTAGEAVLIGPEYPTRVLRVQPTIRIRQIRLLQRTTTTRNQARLEIISPVLRARVRARRRATIVATVAAATAMVRIGTTDKDRTPTTVMPTTVGSRRKAPPGIVVDRTETRGIARCRVPRLSLRTMDKAAA
jgi:hypothetical protein